jgi:hypothetical protein
MATLDNGEGGDLKACPPGNNRGKKSSICPWVYSLLLAVVICAIFQGPPFFNLQ